MCFLFSDHKQIFALKQSITQDRMMALAGYFLLNWERISTLIKEKKEKKEKKKEFPLWKLNQNVLRKHHSVC